MTSKQSIQTLLSNQKIINVLFEILKEPSLEERNKKLKELLDAKSAKLVPEGSVNANENVDAKEEEPFLPPNE